MKLTELKKKQSALHFMIDFLQRQLHEAEDLISNFEIEYNITRNPYPKTLEDWQKENKRFYQLLRKESDSASVRLIKKSIEKCEERINYLLASPEEQIRLDEKMVERMRKLLDELSKIEEEKDENCDTE